MIENFSEICVYLGGPKVFWSLLRSVEGMNALAVRL